MTNDWKRTFQHYSVLALLSLSIVVLISLSLHVKPVFACSTDVSEDGASCTQSGQTSGQGQDQDDSSDDGNNGGNNSGNNGGHNGGSNGGNNDGNSDDDGNGNGNGNGGGSCSPGTATNGTITVQAGSTGLVTSDGSVIPVGSYQLPGGAWVPAGEVPPNMCFTSAATVDSCTGEAYGTQLNSNFMLGAMVSECPTFNPPPPNPCDEFRVNTGGITCTTDFVDSSSFPGSEWQLTVHTPWPGAEIHTRPYPVTLVNWDTVMRVMDLGTSSRSGRLGYIPWGGGSPSDPKPGDWRDVTLRLEIQPVADWAEVFLENIGLIRMRIGELHTLQWNLPSHPAAGGGPLSGQVGQLEELEPDVPLYTNWTRAPYMVYCTISYYEYASRCVSGPDEYGGTDCGRRDAQGRRTGHREWFWRRQSKTTAINPQMAINDVPASLLADLNGDGVPDAYWGRLSFIRRMDDAGNVDNPEWAHSYSWGPVWYWAAREAQGQIGWPGVPVP